MRVLTTVTLAAALTASLSMTACASRRPPLATSLPAGATPADPLGGPGVGGLPVPPGRG